MIFRVKSCFFFFFPPSILHLLSEGKKVFFIGFLVLYRIIGLANDDPSTRYPHDWVLLLNASFFVRSKIHGGSNKRNCNATHVFLGYCMENVVPTTMH